MANMAEKVDEMEMSSPYSRSQNQICYFSTSSRHVTVSSPLVQGKLAITGGMNTAIRCMCWLRDTSVLYAEIM
jgi:hypothetical protein